MVPSEQFLVAIAAACQPGKMTLPPQRWVSSLLQDPAALDGGIYFNCGIRVKTLLRGNVPGSDFTEATKDCVAGLPPTGNSSLAR